MLLITITFLLKMWTIVTEVQKRIRQTDNQAEKIKRKGREGRGALKRIIYGKCKEKGNCGDRNLGINNCDMETI